MLWVTDPKTLMRLILACRRFRWVAFPFKNSSLSSTYGGLYFCQFVVAGFWVQVVFGARVGVVTISVQILTRPTRLPVPGMKILLLLPSNPLSYLNCCIHLSVICNLVSWWILLPRRWLSRSEIRPHYSCLFLPSRRFEAQRPQMRAGRSRPNEHTQRTGPPTSAD